MKKLHISLREDQLEAITKLAELASTSTADVIRQLIDKNADDIRAAIAAWEKGAGLFNPHGNTGRKKKRTRLGAKAL